MKLRRVVTGMEGQKSTVIDDGPPPKVFAAGDDPLGEGAGYVFAEIWASKSSVPDCMTYDDVTTGFSEFQTDLQPGETRFRLVQFPAGMDAPMHATPTIDYIAVVDGEIDLELEDGSETHLVAGDCVVQRGVKHAWHNRTDKPFQMAVVMAGTDLVPGREVSGAGVSVDDER